MVGTDIHIFTIYIFFFLLRKTDNNQSIIFDRNRNVRKLNKVFRDEVEYTGNKE